MSEIRRKYEDLKKRYRDVLASSQALKQVEPAPERGLRGQSGQRLEYQSQPVLNNITMLTDGEDIDSRLDKLKGNGRNQREGNQTQNEGHQQRGPSKENQEQPKSRKKRSRPRKQQVSEKKPEVQPTQQPNDGGQQSVEVWKLRCKFLAEKYFNMIKDMKQNLQQIRIEAIESIAEARREVSDELIGKLQAHFKKNANALDQQLLAKSLTPATQEAFVTPGF